MTRVVWSRGTSGNKDLHYLRNGVGGGRDKDGPWVCSTTGSHLGVENSKKSKGVPVVILFNYLF